MYKEKAIEKLDKTHIMTPVIKNTVYLGMVKSLERAVEDKKDKKKAEKQTENDY